MYKEVIKEQNKMEEQTYKGKNVKSFEPVHILTVDNVLDGIKRSWMVVIQVF